MEPFPDTLNINSDINRRREEERLEHKKVTTPEWFCSFYHTKKTTNMSPSLCSIFTVMQTGRCCRTGVGGGGGGGWGFI